MLYVMQETVGSSWIVDDQDNSRLSIPVGPNDNENLLDNQENARDTERTSLKRYTSSD